MPFEQTNCASFLIAIEVSLNWLSRVAKSLVNNFFCLFRSYNTFYRVDRAILNYPVDRTENIRGNTMKH